MTTQNSGVTVKNPYSTIQTTLNPVTLLTVGLCCMLTGPNSTTPLTDDTTLPIVTTDLFIYYNTSIVDSKHALGHPPPRTQRRSSVAHLYFLGDDFKRV